MTGVVGSRSILLFLALLSTAGCVVSDTDFYVWGTSLKSRHLLGMWASGGRTCATYDDGSAECAGSEIERLVSHDPERWLISHTGVPFPIPFKSDAPIEKVVHSGNASCFIHKGGVRCWGADAQGQLGDGPGTHQFHSVVDGQGQALKGIVDIAAGFLHFCALTVLGKLYCWGISAQNQLGYHAGPLQSPYPNACIHAAGGVRFCHSAILVDTAQRSGEMIAGMALSRDHTCLLYAGRGAVRCFGANDVGQMGLGNIVQNRYTAAGAGIAVTGASSIAAGNAHTCATVGNKVACWGMNHVGQSGPPDTACRFVGPYLACPAPIMTDYGADKPRQVSAGDGFSCVRVEKYSSDVVRSAVDCWGTNELRKLGVRRIYSGACHSQHLPVGNCSYNPVEAVRDGALELASGIAHSCIVSREDDMDRDAIKCWGSALRGAIADGSVIARQTVQKSEILPYRKVVSNGTFSCGIVENNLLGGPVDCWGTNHNMVAFPSLDRVSVKPVRVYSGAASELVLGAFHACVVDLQSKVLCWGENHFGELGRGPNPGSLGVPTEILPPSGVRLLGVKLLAAGFGSTCGYFTIEVNSNLQADRVYCWGNGVRGQLGVGHTNSTNRMTASVTTWTGSRFEPLGSSTANVDLRVVQLTMSSLSETVCASVPGFQQTPSSIYCWGDNRWKQAGAGTLNTHVSARQCSSNNDSCTSAVKLNLQQNLQMISTGAAHGCALTKTGSLYCWGTNAHKQLGHETLRCGTQVAHECELPQLVPTSLGITRLASAGSFNWVVDNRGRIYSFGSNVNGQLGQGSAEYSIATPTPIRYAVDGLPGQIDPLTIHLHARGAVGLEPGNAIRRRFYSVGSNANRTLMFTNNPAFRRPYESVFSFKRYLAVD